MFETRSYSLDDLREAAQGLLNAFRERRVFAFTGNLGAGKTTLIKELCGLLGVNDHMSSPSFAIVNEYHTQQGMPVYHFDLYRLKRPEEALDIGFEEYVYSGHYCFIEWPEMAAEFIPDDAVHVNITDNAGVRIIQAQ